MFTILGLASSTSLVLDSATYLSDDSDSWQTHAIQRSGLQTALPEAATAWVSSMHNASNHDLPVGHARHILPCIAVQS
jgi:hypothetical protein